jgi:hypothetical protein
VFVFSSYFSKTFPSIDEFKTHLPKDSTLVAYNVDWNDGMQPYFMVRFDKVNDTYSAWSDQKDNDIHIYIETAEWKLYS